MKRNPYPTYSKIVKAVKSKKLKEPFYPNDLVKTCRISARAASRYPSRYRKDNPQKKPVYFVRMNNGMYKLARPFKYGM